MKLEQLYEAKKSSKVQEFLGFAYNHKSLKGKFTDLSELEDLFDYAYLRDIENDELVIAVEEMRNRTLEKIKKLVGERVKWVIDNMSEKKEYGKTLEAIAREWTAIVAPKLLEYVNKLNESKKGWAADMAAENRARQKKEREEAKAEEKARKLKSREANKKPPKMDPGRIYHTALDFATRGFPDADPIDYLGPWMEKHGLTMKDVDAAFRKNGEKGGWNGYLIDLWDQFADQAMYDAKLDIDKGRMPEGHNLTFVHYDAKTKKLTKLPNPWK